MRNKLFKLTIVKEWHPPFAQIVIANDELEARQVSYNKYNYEVWLSEEDCQAVEIDTSISQVIDLGMLGPACG